MTVLATRPAALLATALLLAGCTGTPHHGGTHPTSQSLPTSHASPTGHPGANAAPAAPPPAGYVAAEFDEVTNRGTIYLRVGVGIRTVSVREGATVSLLTGFPITIRPGAGAVSLSEDYDFRLEPIRDLPSGVVPTLPSSELPPETRVDLAAACGAMPVLDLAARRAGARVLIPVMSLGRFRPFTGCLAFAYGPDDHPNALRVVDENSDTPLATIWRGRLPAPTAGPAW